MFRLLTKVLGILALVFAVITAVLDLTRTIANSGLTITALGLQWKEFHVASLQNLQVGIQRHLGAPWLWDIIVNYILLLPTWLVFFALAVIFLWMGRRPERRWQRRFGR